MELLAKRGIVVTSYETFKGVTRPVISHIFWGETLDEAAGYAKSHLVSDYFFNSTFIGKMRWRDSTLLLEYDGKFLGIQNVTALRGILAGLEERAQDIHDEPDHYDLEDIVIELSKNLDD